MSRAKRFLIVIATVLWVAASASSDQVFDPALEKIQEDSSIQTGDLLFWGTTNMDSVIIQKFTEGAYSHAGVFWRDSDGRLWLYETHPREGLRRSLIENQFQANEKKKLVAMALVRYNGRLDRAALEERLKDFWEHRDQIAFDQSMALEPGGDFKALLRGERLSLYCTEFIYRLYEGAYSGPVFFENDYPRVYMQRDILAAVPVDQEILYEFQQWLGIRPVEQFQKWLTSHKSQVLITANGMLRGGGFKPVFQAADPARFRAWARRFLDYEGGKVQEKQGADSPPVV